MRRPVTALVALASALVMADARGGPGDQLRKLLPDDGVTSAQFGNDVALDGRTIVVGAWRDSEHGSHAGAAYVFGAVTGQQLFKLFPDDAGAGDGLFGNAVAIDGTTAVIGMSFDDDNGSQSGSAYVFDVATGQQLRKLLPDDGASEDRFGFDLAIAGNVVVVGAPQDDDNGMNSGSVYVFDATTGAQRFKLTPDDASRLDYFGIQVAAADGIALVGAMGSDGNESNTGAAYVFDTTTGQQLLKLVAADGAVNDNFGAAVDLCGSVAIVGAHSDDVSGEQSGSAYLFDVTTGAQLAKLVPGDGAEYDYFGATVAIGDGTALVGALDDDDDGLNSGSAYLFDTSTGLQLAKLHADDADENDRFGTGLALSGSRGVIGASGNDDYGDESGSAYVFDAGLALCLADLTTWNARPGSPGFGEPDGRVTVADLLYYVRAWIERDFGIADITTQGARPGDPQYGVPDGRVSVIDLVYFVNAWVEGCP